MTKQKKVKVKSTGRFRIYDYPAVVGIMKIPEDIAEEVIRNHPDDFKLKKEPKEVKLNGNDTANGTI